MGRRDEDGFTMIELVVVVTVLGIVLSAIAGSLIVVIKTTGATAARTSQSHDAQLLATWLVPDVQSAANVPATPTTAPLAPFQVGDCPAGAERMGSLLLSWTDAATGTVYSARYEVDTTAFALRRTFTSGSAPPTSMVVVHNLEDPRSTQPLPVGATAMYPVCYRSAGGRTTLTVTTLVNRDATRGSVQYAFEVTAQTRTPFGPPAAPAPAPPALTELVSEDINPQNGRVDTIVATFDQAVACTGSPSCDRSRWQVTGQPGAGASVTPSAVVTSANTAALSVAETTSLDTAAVGMKVTLASGSLAGSGGAAQFGPSSVLDGMAPMLTAAASADRDGNGRLDAISLTFSEPLNVVPRKQDFSVSGVPPGSGISDPAPSPDPDPVTGSGTAYTLPLTEATSLDTQVAGMAIRIAGGAATDVAANGSLPGDLGVGEGMAPVLDPSVPPIARDLDGNGRADQVVVTFTEPLATSYTAPPTVWTLTNPPSGASPGSVDPPVGKALTLKLVEGSDPVDTIMAGFKIKLSAHPGGARDAAGNPSSFNATTVSDGVGPLLLGVAAPPNLEPGLIDPTDRLEMTFSEPVTTVPANPTMTVDNETGSLGTTFTVPGLIGSMVLGSRYTVNKLDCTMVRTGSASPSIVSLTVVACNAGAERAAGPGAGTARIDPATKDAAGNMPRPTAAPISLPSEVYF